MNKPEPLDAEKLVEIHKARDEWEGNLLIGFLRDNGIEASFQGEPSVDLDLGHMLKSTDEAFGVYVLEHNAGKARELVGEFLSAATDPTMLEETAAKKLRVDKETITRLRGAIREERQTFEFLGWIAVAFFGAGALLWLAWPAWLRMEPPPVLFRWAMIVLLAMGAVFAAGWSRRRL
jgi:hypothetical protein